MRRLRLMSREEQLLREAVRNILVEVDKDVAAMYAQQGISLGSPEETFFSAIGAITDVVGGFLNFTGSDMVVPNAVMDAASLATAWKVWSKEWARYKQSDEAFEALSLKNQHYEDVNGTPAIDPELIRKTQRYANVRITTSACMFLLSGIAAVSSLIAMIPSPRATAAGTTGEFVAKGVKIVLGLIQFLDSQGVIDMTGTAADATESIKSGLASAGSAWDAVSRTSQHAQLINSVLPDVIAWYNSPGLKRKLKFGAAIAMEDGAGVVDSLYGAVDVVSDYYKTMKA